ncbi:hypothetical protein [Levilactobacillus acidifarinae]|uniref:Phage protein n=1 Tax=Levilactobacillus acidifarinae DSM 19394 = JCM 15949 TaxID=1423715 RepID=A0A0R1LUN9_9LACO|nr:hypothetical protein [Levilactobacillus acidifarinae]KRK96553.1 hypothetical protein FD25_GL002050 [Levilactobacillus acidifarinae DSM 19394]GEO70466.1 hypothetical protein LAC03_23760 [Levilactobacillus acidifarinae]
MMEKSAFEFLTDQANAAADKAIKTDGDGHTFKVGPNVEEYVPDDMPGTILVSTLSSVADFVNQVEDATSRGQLLVQVEGPQRVVVKSALDKYGRRAQFMVAETIYDDFEFNRWYDRETLNIALQSKFVSLPVPEGREYDDKGTLLRFLSAYKESTENTASDDGVTQTATVATGAASVGTAKVPNPVLLAPYRTFSEVEQPQSQFIFRMHEGMKGALFEADAGAWRSEAIQNIKAYFAEKFSKLDSDVVVVLG